MARAALLASVPGLGLAQQPPLAHVAVDVGVAATDNGGLAPSGQERSDLVTLIRPSVALSRKGAGLSVDLKAAALIVGYAHGTQRSGILPALDAAVGATVVERLLFVDSVARIRQAEIDPFGARVENTISANRRTASDYQLTPYVERELGPEATFTGGHEVGLSTNMSGQGGRLLSNRSLVRLERRPTPWGATLEWALLRNQSRDAPANDLTIETLRARGTVAWQQEATFGVTAGQERVELANSRRSAPLVGVTATWNPGPRTEVAATVEHRFFGTGGAVLAHHRSPFLSLSVQASRQPVSALVAGSRLNVFGSAGDSPDLRSLLDDILKTRFPDPDERRSLVEGLVVNRGLATALGSPVDVLAGYPQLQTAANATAVLMTARNVVVVSAYSKALRVLQGGGGAPPAGSSLDTDSRQTGASVQFNRRLTPLLSVDALIERSQIAGLAARAGERSDVTLARLSMTRLLAPRTLGSIGVQRSQFRTTAAGQKPFDADVVSIAITHRF